MAGNNVFNDKDSMDISELASLNDDISPELIEQLQQKLSQDAMNLNGGSKPQFNENDDTTLFEEPKPVEEVEPAAPEEEKQDDIAITKQRFKIVQTVIRHAIVAILTIAVSIPIIYFTINASLEASINNYRQSQTIFQTLYKEKGKIQSMRR